MPLPSADHAIASRRKTAVESFGLASAAIGPITAGMSVFVVTRGQWSFLDAILHILDSTQAPATVSVWSWALADYEVVVLDRLRRDGRVTAGTLMIDEGARKVNVVALQDWRESFGPDSVRLLQSHAKICRVVTADGLKFLLRGSANLNRNPRFEQFDLTEGGADHDLVERIESEFEPLSLDVSTSRVTKGSKISERYDATEIGLFGTVKPWRK